jgi:ketosteroid isomerase-like protein
MKSYLALLALVPVTFLFRPAAAPAVGPGGVIDMQVRLFRALDTGDAAAAAAFVDTDPNGGLADGQDGGLQTPSVFLLDAQGAPIVAHGAENVKKLLAAQAQASKDGGPEWTTRILRSRADCYSGDLSYAVLELERSRGVKGGVHRYRSTALVRHAKDGGWKLMHWHVSSAEAPADSDRR